MIILRPEPKKIGDKSMDYSVFRAAVEKHRREILDAERHIWNDPETGFREWNTCKYLSELYEKAGYKLTMAGNIPGFYTDIDTGRPGPKLLIMGEMDALVAPNHMDGHNGNAHACGHNCQSAALLGVALALKEPGVLDSLSGSIRLMAVPAEELIEIEYRNSLKKQGIITYLGGKVEFLYRGYMDGVDLCYMFHTGTRQDGIWFDCNQGGNGCIAKDVTYHGKAAHAGGSPQKGINALYAASLGLQAINSLRETFMDDDHIRVHPIMTEGGASVNIIPARTKIQSYVRGASLEAIAAANDKVNRAIAAGALALGAEVTVSDRPGYGPLINDPALVEAARSCLSEVFGEERVEINQKWTTGSTDMGDMTAVMPAMHPHFAGSTGVSHGDNYIVANPELACVQSAVGQLCLAASLLSDGAAKAKKIVADFVPRFPSKEAYFAEIDRFMRDWDLVTYEEGNKAAISY